jgi:hypothetical protein
MNQKVSVPAFGLFFLGWWLSSSPLGLFWFTRRRGPPIQNPCCPWVIVFECLGSERAPSPFDESVWQGGARRNAPKGGKIKCLHSDASAWFTALLLLVVVLRDFLDWPLSLSWLGVDPQKPPSGWPFSFFLLLLLSSLGCILTICYLFKWISVRLSGLSGWFFLLLRCETIDRYADGLHWRVPFSLPMPLSLTTRIWGCRHVH